MGILGGLRGNIRLMPMALLLAFGACVLPFWGGAAFAQGNWWDGFATGIPDYTGRRDEPERPERNHDQRHGGERQPGPELHRGQV